jgi:hypothetical protein
VISEPLLSNELLALAPLFQLSSVTTHYYFIYTKLAQVETVLTCILARFLSNLSRDTILFSSDPPGEVLDSTFQQATTGYFHILPKSILP